MLIESIVGYLVEISTQNVVGHLQDRVTEVVVAVLLLLLALRSVIERESLRVSEKERLCAFVVVHNEKGLHF